MATYVIGDIHGALDGLQALLAKLNLATTDELISIGDVVGKGPNDWDVLDLIRSLQIKVILGNHDIQLLAKYADVEEYKGLNKAQQQSIDYLRQAEFAYWHAKTDSLLVHAGVYPGWGIEQTLQHAQQLKPVLLESSLAAIQQELYHNADTQWQDCKDQQAQQRFLLNVFTRMRVIHANGRLDLDYNGNMADMPTGCRAWFAHSSPPCQRVVFGHWAALNACSNSPWAIGIDAGYIYGGALQAFCLETAQIVQVNAAEQGK